MMTTDLALAGVDTSPRLTSAALQRLVAEGAVSDTAEGVIAGDLSDGIVIAIGDDLQILAGGSVDDVPKWNGSAWVAGAVAGLPAHGASGNLLASTGSGWASAHQITSPPAIVGTAGTAITTYTSTATGTVVSWGASGLPAGLSINSGTGEITGTPAGAGVSTVTLTATYGDASTAVRVLSVTVLAAAGMVNPMTTQYDLVVAGAAGTPDRLAVSAKRRRPLQRLPDGSVGYGEILTAHARAGGIFAYGRASGTAAPTNYGPLAGITRTGTSSGTYFMSNNRATGALCQQVTSAGTAGVWATQLCTYAGMWAYAGASCFFYGLSLSSTAQLGLMVATGSAGSSYLMYQTSTFNGGAGQVGFGLRVRGPTPSVWEFVVSNGVTGHYVQCLTSLGATIPWDFDAKYSVAVYQDAYGCHWEIWDVGPVVPVLLGSGTETTDVPSTDGQVAGNNQSVWAGVRVSSGSASAVLDIFTATILGPAGAL